MDPVNLDTISVPSSQSPSRRSPYEGMMTVESLLVMTLMSLGACEKFLCLVYLVRKRETPIEFVMYASCAPFAAS